MSQNNKNNIISNSSSLLNNLKEELLSDIRQTENKVVEQINKRWFQMEETNHTLFEKLNQMMEKNKQIFESLTEQKIKLEKISDYEPFKNKIEAMTTTHEIRINTLLSDMFNVKTKYDKLISDNLTVPGFIGPSCQYRNISEYLLSQILEISKTKNEKEQFKSDIKEYKSRVDGFLKNMVNLNDNSVKRCNEYTDNKEKNIKEYIENILINFESKNLEMRAKIYNNQEKFFEDIKNYMKEFDEILDMKKDINGVLKNKFKEYEKELKKINEKYEEKGKDINHLINKLNHYNKNIKDINLVIKDIQFKETINQMDIIKINAKLKKYNLYNHNNSNDNNTFDININQSINDTLKINNNNSIKNEKFSPVKNNRNPNDEINSFKESLIKGKSVITKKKPDSIRDEFFQLRKNESNKTLLFKDEKKEDSEISENDDGNNKMYKEINYRKNITSNEIINNNIDNNSEIKFIKNKIINQNISITENNINKDNIIKKNSLKRNSNSNYKSNLKEKKYYNFFKRYESETIKNNIKLNHFKKSKLGKKPNEFKQFRTLYSDDFISPPKTTKLIKFKSLTQKSIDDYNKYFNYKVVSLGDNLSLENNSKDFYSLDLENLKKRTIRINLVSPVSNPLKTYQNEKNKNLPNKELNIKVLPAFGSTSYSFFPKK